MNIIADRISKRRKELGITQKELAEILNISDKTLSRWETGKQVPDALMIPEIAKALDISIPEIYGVAHTNNEYIVQSERIDYSRVTSYKFISMLALLMFVVGDGIYSRTGMYDEENENNITSYLICMPHGYKDTDLKVTYYWGIGGKVLKLDFRNTTPFIDDNYYL